MNNVKPSARRARATFSLWAGLSLASLFFVHACGSRRTEDEKTKKDQEASSRDGQSLVIVGQNKSEDAVPVGQGCEIELKQSSTFDPSQQGSQVKVVFRGRIESGCLEGKRPEVLLAATTRLELPGVTCGPEAGDFNIRCSGDIVRVDSSGQLELSFDARDNLDQLKSLRVKVRYR